MTEHSKWLKARKGGIGGSDVSCILGINQYKSKEQLWEEKTGAREPEDISDKDCIKYGKEVEKHLRAIFHLDHPEFEIIYDEYKIYHNEDYPFIQATLDGLLMHKTLGRGIYEAKSTTIQCQSQYEKWKNNSIPMEYYSQCLHEMDSAKGNYCFLDAIIRFESIDEETGIKIINSKLNRYFFMRKQVEIDVVHNAVIKFWGNVTRNERPSTPLKGDIF